MPDKPQQQTPAQLPASGAPCTGCGLCQALCRHGAIRLEENGEGFLTAQVDSERCIRCRACEKTCARLADIRGSEKHDFFEAWHCHAETRQSSSSGGVMTALAEHALRHGGIVFGVTMTGAARPHFIAVEKEEDLPRIRSSKYAQADTTGIMQQLKEAAQSGRPVIFSGVACQVRAARVLLGNRYPNVLLVDLACFGTPSIRLFHAFLRDNHLAAEDVLRVNFRDKSSGWRTYSMTVETKQGEKHAWKNSDNPFMKAFLSKLGLNTCCYSCLAGLDERPGDISLGDFWGRSAQADEKDGVSLLITHTEKGKAALAAVTAQLHLKPEKEENLLRANGGLAPHRAPMPTARAFFIRDVGTNQLNSLLQRYTDRGLPRKGIALLGFFIPYPRLICRLLNKLSLSRRRHS